VPLHDATPELLGPSLFAAFEAKGFSTLTAVQAAVLEADRARDLRVTSQTGSGKTVAIGLSLVPLLETPRPRPSGPSARPRALVITPTRELGRQVEDELRWLFERLPASVTAVTGGASYRDEHRALARQPEVIVATPGRLVDHLEQGSIDASMVEAVVLDEADRMLDMGFSEAIETILGKTPDARRTHLVSATFPPDVQRLADRIQRDPLRLEGTRLGVANADIQHVLYLVDPAERLDALVNLLLAHDGARTLVFTRTRAGVSELDEALTDAGFAVAAISGEMAQRERTRALDSFKRGNLRVLVATDVAARGIDVQDVTLVLHMELPSDPDAYTHRSGRTGRAGKKGTSAVLVAPRELRRAGQLLGRARVPFKLLPMPTPAAIRKSEDERIVARLTSEAEGELDARTTELARRLVAAAGDRLEASVARLLHESGLTRGPSPRDVRILLPEPARPARPVGARPSGRLMPVPGGRFDAGGPRTHAPVTELPPPGGEAPRLPPPPRAPRAEGDFATFQVSWGMQHGADPRRLVAILCRKGDVTSAEIGAIRVGPTSSTVEVRRDRAEHFLAHATRPDARDPRVRVRPLPAYWEPGEAPRGAAPERPRKRPSEAEAALPPERPHKGGGLGPPRRR
jgi:ATP-dependent RNA helicase DeaD